MKDIELEENNSINYSILRIKAKTLFIFTYKNRVMIT
jgi:hypothetical protein